MKNDAVLLRLRAANPFPDEPAGAQARSSTRRRTLIVLAAAFLALAVLASTAFAVSQWIGGDVVEPDVTKAEFLAAQRELAVPPGFEWPVFRAVPNSVTPRGGGGAQAVLIAQNAWECYWVRAIGRHDSAAQVRAHAALERLVRNNMLVAPLGAPEGWIPADPPRVPFAVWAHDGGLEWVKGNYALAAGGHPERLIQSCRANAPG
jgi:hypothetical protein